MAQSLNGYISGPDGRRVALSSDEDWKRVLSLREKSDGIIIGKNTVILDDPELKVGGNCKSARIVIDPRLTIDGKNYKILHGERKTLILNEMKDGIFGNIQYIKCGTPFDLAKSLEILYSMGYRNLLVEGGKITAESFLKAGFVDEMYVFIASVILEDGGIRMPAVSSIRRNAVKRITLINGGILLNIDPGEWK